LRAQHGQRLPVQRARLGAVAQQPVQIRLRKRFGLAADEGEVVRRIRYLVEQRQRRRKIQEGNIENANCEIVPVALSEPGRQIARE
jgi:hypothetical protein